MKNAKIAITSLLSLAIAGQANAQFEYDGSDTLGPIIKNLLDTGACGTINYLEGGSGKGEAAMVAGTQQTAPMSSNLSDEACAANSGAVQAAVGVDKLLVVRNNAGDAACDTDFVQDVPGYSSDAPAWAEALQLVYGGAQGEGGAACSDPARADLINNWASLWENACDSGKCSALKVAFRRGDSSGTTKVFKKLVGITGDFCNGAQDQDNDPIRTDCSNGGRAGGINYCPDGDIGVVQAIDIPKSLPSVDADGNPIRTECVNGNWDFGSAPNFGDTTCPDGATVFAGFLCQYPRDCNDKFGCVNVAFNGSPFSPFMDGRVYNYLLPDSRALPQTVPAGFSGSSLFFNGKCTAGETGANATLQIGCLVNAVECSIGYGGNSMKTAPTTSNAGDSCGQTTAVDNVATRLEGKGLDDAGYPLSRNLFINTLAVPVAGGALDCSAVTNADERALCECIFDPSTLSAAVSAAKFSPLTDGAELYECGGENKL